MSTQDLLAQLRFYEDLINEETSLRYPDLAKVNFAKGFLQGARVDVHDYENSENELQLRKIAELYKITSDRLGRVKLLHKYAFYKGFSIGYRRRCAVRKIGLKSR